MLFRLKEGEALVEVRLAYTDGAWTTTGLECNCEPGFKDKEGLVFQARKLLLEIDALSDKLDRCVRKHKEKRTDHHALKAPRSLRV